MRSPIPLRLLVPAILIVSLSTQPVFLLGAGYFRIGEDLGFSLTGLGGLTALYFLTASAVSPFMGRVVQRIGWRRAMRINAVGLSAVLVAIALFARSTPVLALLLFTAAVIYGFANPAANMSIAEFGDPRRRALVFGIKQSGIPTSTLLAGLAVPVLILSVGWRWAYVAAAGIGVVILLTIPRRDDGLRRPESTHDPRRAVAPMPTGRLATLAGGAALGILGAIALSTYLVAAAVEKGFSEQAAGLLLFGGSIAALTARIVLGGLADRHGWRGFSSLAILSLIGALAFATLPSLEGAAFVALVLAAFATAWGWPGLMVYAVVNADPASAAASSAIPQAGIFVGSGIGPLVLG